MPRQPGDGVAADRNQRRALGPRRGDQTFHEAPRRARAPQAHRRLDMVDDDAPSVAPVVGEDGLALLDHLEAVTRWIVVYFRHEISSASPWLVIAIIVDLEDRGSRSPSPCAPP